LFSKIDPNKYYKILEKANLKEEEYALDLQDNFRVFKE
jgi:hypothetical protein